MSGTGFPGDSQLSHDQSKGVASTPSRSPSHAAIGPVAAAGVQAENPDLPTPAKNGALEKAIQEYVSRLSNDDMAAFQSAPDIVEHLQEMQLNNKPCISNSLTTRVQRVLQDIGGFMDSLGNFIQLSPEISTLGVGGCNYILTVGT